MKKQRPTAAGFKAFMEASGHPPLRLLDVISRGLYFRDYSNSLNK